jgi:hypothetical protein
MVRWTKSGEELQLELREQLEALAASCKGFDSGSLWEAKRIATIVSTLVHDHGRTTSLLSQLYLKDKIAYLTSGSGWSDTSITTQLPLVRLEFSAESMSATYKPLLGDFVGTSRPVKFLKWWDEPILRDSKRRVLTRKNLVCSLRDQDGGSHVDGALTDEAYASLSRENGASWYILTGGFESAVKPGPHLATMRQIAWEIETSLHGFQNTDAHKETA